MSQDSEAQLMVLSKAWRELHAKHFSELPLDCANRKNPGIVYSEDFRDWSQKATTTDQARMERYIDRYDLRQKRVLHIGIGSSRVARRFHRRTKQIVGTTIDEPEIRVASSLQIPNYQFVLHNKYSGSHDTVPGKFDIILDNNPTSPCCCLRHLSDLFDFYAAKLAEGGQIVTDRQGLSWLPEDSEPRWSFTFEDLAAVGAVAGFSAYKMNRTVYVLSRSPPPPPGVFPLTRHLLRSAKALPGQIARNGPREFKRLTHEWLTRILGPTVPWALPTRYRAGK
jgi:hypothetical protein